MGIRVDVDLGPLHWSRPIRIPRAQRNALNLIGALAYLVLLGGLWLGYVFALFYDWQFAITFFLAIGLVLGSGLWWIGRRAWDQWGPELRKLSPVVHKPANVNRSGK